MKIIEENNWKILVSEEGYLLRQRDDEYKEGYIDGFGNQIREHVPYYFEKAYLPKNITIEDVKNIYEEIEKKEVE